MELITLKDIHKTYHVGELDVPVLKGVTLEIGKGEMVALMGSSGSGKTTLMNLLGCLDRPTSGQYWLDGVEISRLTPLQQADVRNRRIGFVFQSFNLLARTTAVENVMMPLDYAQHPVNEKEARARAIRLLELVGVGHRMHHHPAQLSGGQQQRVAIARALVNEPSLLLADEPTGNLDQRTSERVFGTLTQLVRASGVAAVIATHNLDIAAQMDRRVTIREGMVVELE
jgi:ABC-type lipoprotein export system ATPase subunit